MPIVIHHHLIDRLAIIVAFSSGFALYPQVWKLYTLGPTEHISLITFSLMFLNSCVWVVYAFHRRLLSLAIASFFNLGATGAVLFWFWFIV